MVELVVEGDGGVDQRQVGEGLGEVAQLLAGLADLLGVQAEVDAVGERLGLSSERVASVLACYGNTTGATLPLALDAAVTAGKLKRGDLMVFAAVGAGFTAGATLVRWS